MQRLVIPATACASVNEPEAHFPDWMRLAGAGVTIAHFAGFDDEERFLVATVVGEPPRPAASIISLREQHIDCEVILAFDSGDARRPVILGILQRRRELQMPLAASVRVDGDKLLLQAEREIELRCGEATLVLTRAGKVLIRGTYVLSRSRGANRIKGAYVDIN